MAVNKLMHPRNIYKTPPDFKQLAIEYEEFRQHAVQDLTGKVHIDFKDPDALRALTSTLLKKDFGLNVEIPVDRLIPTVPQRLNYVLWLEDLLKDDIDDVTVKRGIDIGTGASCVFPLLGSSKNGWQFLATESDLASYECAVRNVQKNNLEDKVKVLHVLESTSLQNIFKDDDSEYDFCMCNPPFFCDNFDASWEAKARKKCREGPRGANTASPVETITEGGEVEFVKKIIADSLALKERIRIYTTMLGKKISVAIIKEHLKEKQVPNFVTTEFQQGKTLRWGVAWTFNPRIKLNKISIPKTVKPVKSLSFFVPSTLKCVEYSVLGILQKTEEFLKELGVLYHVSQRKQTCSKMWIRSNKNTWSHQRRKRRELLRQTTPSEQPQSSSSVEASLSTNDSSLVGKSTSTGTQNDKDATLNHDNETSQSNCNGSKRKCSEGNDDFSNNEKTEQSEVTENGECDTTSTANCKDEKFLLFADISISSAGKCILVELKARREMTSREMLHQIMQFLKNKLV